MTRRQVRAVSQDLDVGFVPVETAVGLGPRPNARGPPVGRARASAPTRGDEEAGTALVDRPPRLAVPYLSPRRRLVSAPASDAAAAADASLPPPVHPGLGRHGLAGRDLSALSGTAKRTVVAGKGKKPTEVVVDLDRVRALLSGADPAPAETYVAPTAAETFWRKLRLTLFALPWRRFPSESILCVRIGGDVPERVQGRFGGGDGVSVPGLCATLRKAAVDPRIKGLAVRVDPVSVGWARVNEISRALEAFRASGKPCLAWIAAGGEKEYVLAASCGRVACPPTAYVGLRGLTVGGTFVRSALDKAGVEPEVRRIGVYKSAGDQLLRRDMSEAQREQLAGLLDGAFDGFVSSAARLRGKTEAEVRDLVDRGEFDMAALQREGWVDDLWFEGDVRKWIEDTSGGKEGEARQVGWGKYRFSGGSDLLGLNKGRRAVAVLRANGNIGSALGGEGQDKPGAISAQPFCRSLRALRDDPRVAAIVVRVDSGGGDALASSLMWDEIRRVAERKPVVCSMGDVAASGGYYMAAGADFILADSLTVTGSIGVVTGKFSLETLYERIGVKKELLSRGTYAEALSDARPLTDVEGANLDASAAHAYASFRGHAAASRGLTVDEAEAVAQGRVWTGADAKERGLVDGLGGVARAVAVAEALAGRPADKADGGRAERFRVLEVSRGKPTPAQVLAGAGAAARAVLGGDLGAPGIGLGLGGLGLGPGGGDDGGGVAWGDGGHASETDALLAELGVAGGPLGEAARVAARAAGFAAPTAVVSVSASYEGPLL